ncbi:MAG: Nif3-like dinuclear metal center hexameric protein [unclassified Hahellaceae]|nr:Nif3-like dinuclear metal center hexameric protein [Hahellaceae bacterium]|tara:strand:+ start:69347 stop:70120 length:774 start_codon:yes stop_codon:yes gene_type:complete
MVKVALVERTAIEKWLNVVLEPEQVKDYCPNGLQVEGRTQIAKVLLGVTASQALVDEAARWGADMILVHHGWFWKNEPLTVTGQKYRRMKALMHHDINLFAYHLPLDIHAEYGNNATLAETLGLQVEARQTLMGVKDLLWYGRVAEPCQADVFARHIEKRLQRKPLLLGDSQKMVRSVAWCTGGAQSAIDDAIELGVDAFISGEASEQTYHAAMENDIVYYAAGHDATERYGVQALGAALAAEFGLETRFFDLGNPV